MKKEEIQKKVKLAVIILVVAFIIWFLILNPIVKFKSNENKMLNAGKRYFEINSSLLPTGTRVGTVYLKDLYSKSFLEDDFYIPFTKQACSVTKSFVKVKRVDGEYKYYAYLKCGVMQSVIDHTGPVVTLNGEDSITIDKGSKYEELGVKSVTDKTDGDININQVEIDSKNVNTKKVGTYKVTYTVFDSFSNKTEKVRTVKVVEKIKNTVKTATNNTGIYTGNPNNYIYFSGMLFRIIGLDDNNNVKIVADQDISNVNYAGIDKWLDYYYDHLTEKSKEMIVSNKYCNMKVNDDNINNVTNCSSYTDKKKVYIPSVVDINKSLVDGSSFMKPQSMSWTANKYDDKEAYLTRNVFYGDYFGKNYMKYNVSNNYGVRPVITIKGDALIKGGNGTSDNPYSIGDFTRGKAKDLLNTRYTGEYFKYSGYLFRIIDVESDGTVKVIRDDNIKEDGISVTTYYNGKTNIYNPTEKGNVGYFINNKISEFISLDYFVKKEIEVPIYKDEIKYKKEESTKKYEVKVSSPNMYEMFSAFTYNDDQMQSYWFVNSSKNEERANAITDIGVFTNEEGWSASEFGIRLVGYMNKDVVIVSGRGTKTKPYVISK